MGTVPKTSTKRGGGGALAVPMSSAPTTRIPDRAYDEIATVLLEVADRLRPK
jgi:hypothetical protein